MRKRIITVSGMSLLAIALALPAAAAPIFTFDDVAAFTTVPFSSTSEGITATFGELDAGAAFLVGISFFSTLTGNVLLDADPVPHTLTVTFSAPFNVISLLFALNGPETNTFTLTALLGGLGGAIVGSATATGAIPPGAAFSFPEGQISFTGALFDAIELTSSAPDFAIDRVALSSPTPVPEPGTLFMVALGSLVIASRRVIQGASRSLVRHHRSGRA